MNRRTFISRISTVVLGVGLLGAEFSLKASEATRVVRSNWSELIREDLRKIFIEEYNNLMPEYPKLINLDGRG